MERELVVEEECLQTREKTSMAKQLKLGVGGGVGGAASSDWLVKKKEVESFRR